MKPRKLNPIIVAVVVMVCAGSVKACPNLAGYYPQGDVDWVALTAELDALMPECLESSEFFALYGAAQLNSADFDAALEALERALLIDPDNGAAQIDYAEALFQQGQIFPALELNEKLLARTDLPVSLQPMLQDRQQTWRGLTRQHVMQLDVLTGYDSNLNGAPDSGQITLTLSGEPVILNLNPEFRPVDGPYLNLRLGSQFRQLSAESQHNWTTQLRGRLSEDTASDLLQLDTRYSLIRPRRGRSWQLDTGLSSLLFGGKVLYTATEGRFRYMGSRLGACQPYASLAVQHQIFHNQSHLNAVESKASGGVSCPLSASGNQQAVTAEVSLLENTAIKSDRPGGNRGGWQFSANWYYELNKGTISAQVNHTELHDRKGYSPLLAGGAQRQLTRSFVLLQYLRPLPALGENTAFMVNYFHQHQRSNVELFRSIDNTFELGLSLTF